MKQTQLNENADIYKQRKEVSEKQKMSEMTTRQKISYFNDYYRNKLIIGLITGGLLVYLIVTIFSPRVDPALNVAIINDILDKERLSTLESDFTTQLGLDPKDEQVLLDSSYYIMDDMDSASVTSQQRLLTYIAASQIDIIITDEAQFQRYINMGYMENLSERLPTDLYSDLSDSFCVGKAEEDTVEKAYGIYLNQSEVYKNLGSVIEQPVIGILINSKNKENSVAFVKYLLNIPY